MRTSRFPASRGMLVLAAVAWGLVARSAPAQPADAATRQYAATVALQNRGVYDLAAEEWQKFIERYPTDARIPRAHHYLGVCYYQRGQYEPALRAFQTVIAKYPKFELLPASHLYLGVTQYALAKSGKAELYDQAARTFRSLLAKDPKGEYAPDALYYLGECAYARGNKAEAIKQYTQLVGKYPAHKLAPDALYALGVAQEESSQAEAAAKTYDAFLKRFAEHRLATEVLMRRGETLLAAGEHAEAAKRFAAASQVEGFSLADYATLRHGDALLQMKQYAEAAAVYASIPVKFPRSQHAERAAVRAGKSECLAGNYAEAQRLLKPLVDAGGASAPEAAHWLAQALLKEKRPDAALAAIEKALPGAAQSPQAAQLLLDRADAAYEIPGERKRAAGLYAQVAAKYPQDPLAPQALYMAAFAALEQQDAAAAMAHADAFLVAHRDHPLAADAAYVAAESRMQLGRFAEADRLYRHLAERHPKHADADLWKVRRIVALHAQKKYRETIAALGPLVTQLRSPASIAEARFLLGSSQLELKESEAAIRSLTAALAAEPKWRRADETLLALAQAYRDAGDPAKAKAAISRLLADYPGSRLLDQAHYRLGELHWQEGDYAAAAEEYRRVIAGWPQSPLVPHATHDLGCAQLNQKDPAGAERTLSGLLERFPQHAVAARARYARGMARHQLAKYALAVEDLRAMVAAEPASKDKSDARLLLGLCQLELKEYDAAVATLRGLLKENPQYGAADKVRYQLAWALKLSGREEEAGKAFAALLAADPESPLAPEALHNVGEAAYKNKNYAAAAKAYYEAVQKSDGTPLGEKSSHKLGWCYYHQGNFANAEKTFAYQVAQYPDGPLAADGAVMAAECLFKQEKYAEALAAYERLKRFPNGDFEMLARLHAGQAAAQLKQWDRSAAWLTQCAQKFPDAPNAPEAVYELGWALQNLGKHPEAIARYEQVIAKTDREVAARAQFMIGEIQFENKKHNEAVKSFFKVAYGYGHAKWQADATYEAGRCFEVLGKSSQAVKMYQELLEKFPTSDRVALAKERLADLRR